MAESSKKTRGGASSTKSASAKSTKKASTRSASATTRPVKPVKSTTPANPEVVVHKTASQPTSPLKTKLFAIMGDTWKTLRQRTLWIWVGGIAAAILVVLMAWWQWQRSYVAVVNGQYVPTTTLYGQLMANNGTETISSITQQQLILQKAHQDKINVSNDEINAELDKFKKTTGGSEQFKASLKEFGISEDLLRNQIEVRLSLEKILADEIEVSEQEIQDYYDNNKEEVDLANEGLEGARERIQTQLREQKLNQASSNFIESLQQGGKVEIFPHHTSLTFGQFLEDEVWTIPSEVWTLLTGSKD